MKIDMLVNFDFGKLEKKWVDSIKPKIMESVPKDTARRWKKNIKEKQFTPLKDSTIQIRKNRGTGGCKPLFDAGNLYKSKTPHKGSVKYLAYGEYHLEEQKTSENSLIHSVKTVPPRKWIDKRFSLLTEKTKKRIFKEIKLGLKLAGRGKIIARY